VAKNRQQYDFDVIAIGAGTTSLTAIKTLAKEGGGKLRLAMIEREAEKVGGDCLFYGCVPTKTLLATAKLYHDLQTKAATRGIQAESVRLDFAAAMQHAHATVNRIGEVSDAPAFYRDLGVELVWGDAGFVDPHTIQVGERRMTAASFVIGTGSQPIVPEIGGLERGEILTNETVLQLSTLPESMLILGGGPIGCEFGQMFARFGCQVTIVDHGDSLLSKEDEEVAAMLRGYLEAEGIRIILGADVQGASKRGKLKTLTIRHDGAEEQLKVEAVLSAVGREADLAALHLEAAGVAVAQDEQGKVQGIQVNDHLQTSVAHIWAGGDCVGPYYFTHVAEQEGRFIARNILGGKQKRNYAALPWVTFTSPELAHLGQTEADARAAHGDNVVVTKLKFSEIDRARIEGDEEGMIKLITTKGVLGSPVAVRILGAHILGPAAGELIHEFATAMSAGINPGLFALALHAYPTLALANRQVLGDRFTAKDE